MFLGTKASARGPTGVLNRDCALARGTIGHWPLTDACGGFPANRLAPTNISHHGDPLVGLVGQHGSGSYWTSPDVVPLNLGSFSLSLWCLTTTTSSSSGGGGLRYLVGTETAAGTDATAGNGEMQVRYSPSSGKVQALLLQSGETNVVGATSLVAHVPYHLTVVFDANAATLTYYLNGKSDGSGGTSSRTAASKVITVGSDNGFNSRLRQWNGWIGGLVMWGRVITPEEAWALYDPQTRWDLYWTPSTKVYAFLGASGGGGGGAIKHLTLLGIGS